MTTRKMASRMKGTTKLSGRSYGSSGSSGPGGGSGEGEGTMGEGEGSGMMGDGDGSGSSPQKAAASAPPHSRRRWRLQAAGSVQLRVGGRGRPTRRRLAGTAAAAAAAAGWESQGVSARQLHEGRPADRGRRRHPQLPNSKTPRGRPASSSPQQQRRLQAAVQHPVRQLHHRAPGHAGGRGTASKSPGPAACSPFPRLLAYSAIDRRALAAYMSAQNAREFPRVGCRRRRHRQVVSHGPDVVVCQHGAMLPLIPRATYRCRKLHRM